jgi:hypothetical protein
LFDKIWEISNETVAFYTAKLGENELFEFELFEEKDFPEHGEELQIIYNVIDQIRKRGAKQYFFKHEGPANALPIVTDAIKTANKVDFGLRLYCIRLSDNVLILLNGDVKTTLHPEKCENVKVHFRNAYKIAQKLDKLLIAGEVNFQYEDCLVNFEIEI